MTQPGTDELLAALLDGQLDPDQRAALLARLAQGGEDDDDLAVLAGTAAVLGALEEEEKAGEPEQAIAPAPGPVLVPPSTGAAERSRRAWPRTPRRWLALAAAVAAVALTPLLVSRARAPGINDPSRPAALLAGARVPEGWPPGGRRWTTRGGDAREDALAVRLGVSHVDLELAVGARDRAATDSIATQMTGLLREFTASAAVAADYEEIAQRAGAPPGELEELMQRAAEGLLLIAGEDLVGLGAWSEGGLIAAHRRNEAFFRSRDTRRALQHAAGLELSETAQAAIARIRTLLAAEEGALDWEALAAAFNDLQGATGR